MSANDFKSVFAKFTQVNSPDPNTPIILSLPNILSGQGASGNVTLNTLTSSGVAPITTLETIEDTYAGMRGSNTDFFNSFVKLTPQDIGAHDCLSPPLTFDVTATIPLQQIIFAVAIDGHVGCIVSHNQLGLLAVVEHVSTFQNMSGFARFTSRVSQDLSGGSCPDILTVPRGGDIYVNLHYLDAETGSEGAFNLQGISFAEVPVVESVLDIVGENT